MGSICRVVVRGMSMCFLCFPVLVNLPTQKVFQYILEGLWTCCRPCGFSSDSDIPLLLQVLALKDYSIPPSAQSQVNCGILIHCTCYFQGDSPSLFTQSSALIFLTHLMSCKSFSSVSQSWHKGPRVATYSGLFAPLYCGKGGIPETPPACVGIAFCDWTTRGFATAQDGLCIYQGSWSWFGGPSAKTSCLGS